MDGDIYLKYEKAFAESLANDINTSSAMTVLYDVLKADTDDTTKALLILRFDEVLSIDLKRAFMPAEADGDADSAGEDAELAAFVEEKIAERAAAKKAKDFAKADAIRDELAEKGIVLKDTREGTTWERA